MSEITNVVPVNIEEEMRGAYLDYAMSVIVGRALPDVRDGLKPVHRRVLYAMYDQGYLHNKAYKKSSRVVGEVLGKYHPHGDGPVYDTVVRMAQDFSLRYPLIDGQGNFGSVDGDPPAAMRYTEVRMTKVAEDLLSDIEKQTVDFIPNYDESTLEPTILPTKIPNLLVNGSSGIAVGMATNIPPHNLTEVVNGLLAMVDQPDITIQELLQYVKGPDFPTSGIINGDRGIKEAYLTGRGSVVMRGRVDIETHPKTGRETIIINEIPYQVNKAKLIERIADLVRDKKIEGISDIRDESNRVGMRIVIEVKKNESASVIVNNLYKQTALESTFGMLMLALDHGQPKIMNLKQLMKGFLDFRTEVTTRRIVFELRQAEGRAHILKGLTIALDNLDEIIKVIRGSNDPKVAKAQLVSNFKLSEIQSQAILDLRLQRLTALERDKIIAELKEIEALIARLMKILADPVEITNIIREELLDVRARYGDERRTEIIADSMDLEIEDLIPKEDQIVLVTHSGYVKRVSPDQYRVQKRGGKGTKGNTGEEDVVKDIFQASTHDYLMAITDAGKAFFLKVYKIPEAARTAKGRAIVNLINLGPGESVKTLLPVKAFADDRFVFMATRNGIVKKTVLSDFQNIRSAGVKAIIFDEGDELIAAGLTNGTNDIILCSRLGQAIRFGEDDVRAMGRSSRGVRGMDLDDGDLVVGMEIINKDLPTLLSITSRGYGKRTATEEYRIQSRGGKGIILMKTTDKTGDIVGIKQVGDQHELMVVTDKGQTIRTRISEISVIGRATQGVRIINVDANEQVVSIEALTISAEEDIPESPTSGNA